MLKKLNKTVNICVRVLTFCVWGEEDDVAKGWNVVFDNRWCVGLGRAESEVIASFWILCKH
jgi:hypothetical protein